MAPEISVLVPVYNWSARDLAAVLRREIIDGGLESRVDVTFLDDASTDQEKREANRRFFAEASFPWEHYRENAANIGRARTCNALADGAAGKWILFIDVDCLPDDSTFLRRYLEEIGKDSADAICGGTGYAQRVLFGPEYDFYIHLVTTAGQNQAVVRNRIPWAIVLTSNMLVRREVFQKLPFDSRFLKYGYEDQEWGIRVQREFRLLHIDNLVSHLGLQTKEELYRKMQLSIGNYHLIRKWHPEAFAQSRIAPIEAFFARFSRQTLRKFDRFLSRLFMAIHKPFLVPYYCYQLDKAVLLALESRAEMEQPKQP